MMRIAVLMSGGIDSSVAALLAKQAGTEVIGLTARMAGGGSRCCGDEDIYRAQRVCHHLGIPHRVLDLTKSFEDLVISDFVKSYAGGLTPNPCAICNARIKFGLLVETAWSFGFERVASGHYARLADLGGVPVFAEPEDARKSQVYFLALVGAEVLPRLEFPLSRLRKEEVRRLASAAGLPARGTESQDLCFVVSGTYQHVLEAHSAWPGPGDVVDAGGRVVGRHKGHTAYTVGQRFGLGGKRLYVIGKRSRANQIAVGPRESALARSITAHRLNRFLGVEPRPGAVIMVKYRYNTPAAAATVAEAGGDHIRVVLQESAFAPAPGQVLACYQDGALVLGGTITEAGDAARSG